MSQSKKYICITIIFLCFILIGTVLDIWFNTKNIFSLFTKLIIIILSLVILKRLKLPKNESNVTIKDILISLVPMVFSTLLIFGPINKFPSTFTVVTGTLSVAATAIWEELHFRVIGTGMLKGEKQKLDIKSVILLILIFGFSHAINILLKPNEVMLELFRIIFSAATGSLFLALYLKTNNITLSILSHFLLNYITLFFKTFSTSPNYLGYIAYDVIYYISVVTYFVIAYIMFKKYELVNRDNRF